MLDGVSVKLHALAAFCRIKSPEFPLNRKLGELRTGVDVVDKNNPLTLPGIELHFLSFPTCILMTIPTELFWHLLCCSACVNTHQLIVFVFTFYIFELIGWFNFYRNRITIEFYAVSVEHKLLSMFEAENLFSVLCVSSCRSVLMNPSQARVLISISIVSCIYKVY